MIRDTTLLQHIQLALMGIVLVVGLFYIWRSIARLEDRIERLGRECCGGNAACAKNMYPRENFQMPMTPDLGADEIMKHVFGGDDTTFVMYSSPSDIEPTTSAVCIEEIPTVVEEPKDVPTREEDEPSEVGTADQSNPLSKSKLKRMNIDTLKELCKERDLPTDGSKAVLMDRLLGLTRD